MRGGGSIARVGELGLLKVGPESAGAEPGPACYGQGGVEPTVTDANLLLGYLDPAYFLGGRMALDSAAAETADGRPRRAASVSSVADAAWGVYDLVSENMAGAARVHIVEKGREPAPLRDGGDGRGGAPSRGARRPQARSARGGGCRPRPGAASALGFLAAPVAYEASRSLADAARIRGLRRRRSAPPRAGGGGARTARGRRGRHGRGRGAPCARGAGRRDGRRGGGRRRRRLEAGRPEGRRPRSRRAQGPGTGSRCSGWRTCGFAARCTRSRFRFPPSLSRPRISPRSSRRSRPSTSAAMPTSTKGAEIEVLSWRVACTGAGARAVRPAHRHRCGPRRARRPRG